MTLPLSSDAIFSTDNGALLCGAHCGHTARVTGRDISGQPVMQIDAEYAVEFEALVGVPPTCEVCGRGVSS